MYVTMYNSPLGEHKSKYFTYKAQYHVTLKLE